MWEPRPAARRAAVLARRAVGEFFEDGCPQRAAAISYYGLFSLFPMAILAVAGLGLLVDDAAARERVIATVLDQLPLREGEGRREIEGLLRDVTSQRGAFSVVGAVALLFAASGVMGAIRHALNAAWNVEQPRPVLRGKLLDILLVLGFGAMVTASFVLTLAIRLTDSLTDPLGDAGQAVDSVILELSRLAPALLALVTFTILFRIVPAVRPGWRDIWPGVLVAAAGYELAKAGFAFYLDSFARYGTVYASLGTAVAFMAFLFVAANVVLLGAETASEWPAVRAGKREAEDVDEERPGEPGGPWHQRAWRAARSLFVRDPGDEEPSQPPARGSARERSR